MPTFSKQHGRYFLQFSHKERTPKKNRVSFRTSKKREAEALRSKLEHDYVTGLFDPWTYDPFTYDRQIRNVESMTCFQALELFLHQKKSEVEARIPPIRIGGSSEPLCGK